MKLTTHLNPVQYGFIHIKNKVFIQEVDGMRLHKLIKKDNLSGIFIIEDFFTSINQGVFNKWGWNEIMKMLNIYYEFWDKR